MNLLKYLFKRQAGEVLIGGKTMDQLRQEYNLRTRREQMRKYPQRYRNGGQVALSFE